MIIKMFGMQDMLVGVMDIFVVINEWVMVEIICNQEIQCKFQNEFDLVVGCDCNVQEFDFLNMLYFMCIMKEIF